MLYTFLFSGDFSEPRSRNKNYESAMFGEAAYLVIGTPSDTLSPLWFTADDLLMEGLGGVSSANNGTATSPGGRICKTYYRKISKADISRSLQRSPVFPVIWFGCIAPDTKGILTSR